MWQRFYARHTQQKYVNNQTLTNRKVVSTCIKEETNKTGAMNQMITM